MRRKWAGTWEMTYLSVYEKNRPLRELFRDDSRWWIVKDAGFTKSLVKTKGKSMRWINETTTRRTVRVVQSGIKAAWLKFHRFIFVVVTHVLYSTYSVRSSAYLPHFEDSSYFSHRGIHVVEYRAQSTTKNRIKTMNTLTLFLELYILAFVDPLQHDTMQPGDISEACSYLSTVQDVFESSFGFFRDE